MTAPTSPFRLTFAAALSALGLLHLLGFVSSLRLAQVPGWPYRTSVLGGHLDLGPLGTAVLGGLWGVAATGFLLSALALALGWPTWRASLLGAGLLSTLLCSLDLSPVALGLLLCSAALLLILVFVFPSGRRLPPHPGDFTGGPS